ncbi:MAG: hypothetical protein ACLR5O_00325 [Romboutsia timonensis]|uniref:hypothetical protein n=1 Tax=Romboutsia timonensis TaxID=1776391 RepID=UPI00399F4B4A
MKNVEEVMLKMVSERKHEDSNYVGLLNFNAIDNSDDELDVLFDNFDFFKNLNEKNKKFIERLGDKMMLEVMTTEGLLTNENIYLFRYFSKIIGIKNIYNFGRKYKLSLDNFTRRINRATILFEFIKELKDGKVFCIGNELYGLTSAFNISDDNWYDWCVLKKDQILKRVYKVEDEEIIKVEITKALQITRPITMTF